jgi:hypothetical protein
MKKSKRAQKKGDGVVRDDYFLSNTAGMQTFTTDENFTIATVTADGGPQSGGLAFTASLLPTFSSLSALFEYYRITWLEVVFRPVGITEVVQDTAGATAPVIPRLYTVVDINDVTTPPNLASLERASTMLNCAAIHAMRRSFVPRWQTMIYNGVLATAYGPGPTNTWLNCTNGAIPHFGLKYWLTPDGGAGSSGHQQFTYELVGKMRVQFYRRR